MKTICTFCRRTYQDDGDPKTLQHISHGYCCREHFVRDAVRMNATWTMIERSLRQQGADELEINWMHGIALNEAGKLGKKI